jgi:hypothetical protein
VFWLSKVMICTSQESQPCEPNRDIWKREALRGRQKQEKVRPLPPQAFLQAHEALIAYYKVIDQFNVKVLACRDQLLCYCDIFWRRRGIATGVIVADDDSRTVAYDSGSIDIC